MHRGLTGTEHVQVGGRHSRCTGKKRSGQVRPEQAHSRSRLVRVPPPTDYKLAWNGGWLVAVPPQNTSRTCPCCGHVSADNRKTQIQFLCVKCGFEENVDLVVATNVLRAGRARLACKMSGAVMPPAAGIHRSDSCVAQCQA
ncbi:zinc ribbon domain-containing protein [Escherichia coli]|uniref:zinc ribbon domain-containing protein n=1 Tax=Escherichia coli TaxID=562 RepID=UPI002DDBD500|nr:zinc ribbon domain-containing protein [Escherichia coli]